MPESTEQKRQRYLRRAVEARELAEKLPPQLRSSALAVVESWERLASQSEERADNSGYVPQNTVYYVRNWLLRNSGIGFCDECIGRDINMVFEDVADATRELASEPGFSKYAGRCDACRMLKVVSAASTELMFRAEVHELRDLAAEESDAKTKEMLLDTAAWYEKVADILGDR